MGRDLDAAELDRLGRHPERRVRDRRGEAHELLDGVGDAAGIVAQDAPLVRMVEQRDDAVADQARRGVVAGDDQLEEARQQLLLGQAVAVGTGEQDGDEVVAGPAALGLDQLAQVADDGVRGGHGGGRRSRRPTATAACGTSRPAAPGRRGDAEQLADDDERERAGEAVDEIDDRARARRRERVEQVVGEAHDRWLQRGDAGGQERRGDEGPQAGVVGRVDVEHVPGERRSGEALGDDVAVGGQCAEHVLGDPSVVERLAGRVVTDDEPGLVTVGQADLVHGAAGLRLGEVGERVVADRRRPTRPTSSRPCHSPRASGLKPEQSSDRRWIGSPGSASA